MPPSTEQPTKKVRVLILGFGNEGKFSENISEKVLEELATRFGADNFEVITHVLPVEPELSKTQKHLRDVFDATHPDVIIPTGQDGTKEAVDRLKKNPINDAWVGKPLMTYIANAENSYNNGEKGFVSQAIDPALPTTSRRNVFFTPGLIPFPPAVVNGAVEDSQMAIKNKKPLDIRPAGDGEGHLVVDLEGREYIDNYLCNLVLYESQRWQEQQEKIKHPMLVTPFVHMFNPYTTPEDQEKFTRYYADHLEIFARRAAAIEEVKLIIADPHHPHYKMFSSDSADTPEKAIISAMQYQLFKQGFLQQTENSSCSVDGTYSKDTYEALMRFAACKTVNGTVPDKGWRGYGHAIDEIIEYGKNMNVSLQKAHDVLSMPQQTAYSPSYAGIFGNSAYAASSTSAKSDSKTVVPRF